MGIPGAYFVAAAEFNDEGPFASLDDAIAWAECNYSEHIARAAAEREE
ncbi:MAG: hypothetical protein P4L66_12940 [Acetobacteraceae bacterium]|nr:hypothetical protein [Acetobacteraceae bacterium]